MCNFFIIIHFRFGSQHLTPSGRNIINTSLYEKFLQTKSTVNRLDKSVQFSLRKRGYDFSKSDSVITKHDRKSKEKTQYRHSKKHLIQNENSKEQETKLNGENTSLHDENSADGHFSCEVDSEHDGSENCTGGASVMSSGVVRTCGAVTDEDVIEVRKQERKRVMDTATGILN